jgi:replicative DNA helicase
MTSWPVSPPTNLEAEQRVLGTMLVFYKPQLVHVVQAAGVRWSDFYHDRNRIIYRAILKMHGAGEHVEAGTVARFLECQRHATAGSWLVAAGGRGTLELLECGAHAAGFREYALIVAEDGRWRRWLNAMFDALESIGMRDEPAFWTALARVREDLSPGELHVVEGGKEKAA